jgi:hypothetical protein
MVKKCRVWSVKSCRRADGKVGQDLAKIAREKHPDWVISKPWGQLDGFIIINESVSQGENRNGIEIDA